MAIVVFCVTAFVATMILTGVIRQAALQRQIMDIPNSRSSHSVPTPRGGGLAIVAVLLVMFVVMPMFYPDLEFYAWLIVGACAPVALIGLWDDFHHVAARWRLLIHFVSLSFAVIYLGKMPAISLFGYSYEPGFLVAAAAVLSMVWLLNLFNFMDGIDGIAAMEVITAGIAIALLSWIVKSDSLYWILPLVMAFSAAGFMIWNFPPAKIFMGDVGSGFIGALLGVLAISASWVDQSLLWAWIILLGVFVVDATVTLLRRLLRGDKVYQAHRSHAYQYASRLYGSHLPVTIAVGAINLLFLLPIASLVAFQKLDGAVGVIVAYLPLILLALYFKSGDTEERQLLAGK